MLAQERQFYTHAEYLALEEKADYRSEYRQGEMVAMAGASVNHNRITINVSTVLTNTFAEKPCEAFSTDLRVWVERRNLFTYPDVLATCGDLTFYEGRTDTITNPQVIIEVLSESTAAYDRGEKFQAYWTLDSLAEYVLIDQYRVRIEYFQRISEKEWRLIVLTKTDDVLPLESVGVELPLDQIYRNVAWEEKNEKPA
jgi:Uma2 family endonuclease